MKVTVCLESLFRYLIGNDTEEEYVICKYDSVIERMEEDGNEYFDLRSTQGKYPHSILYGILCMDGETCEVIEQNEEFVLLHNEEGETADDEDGATFKLSKDEFEHCCTPYLS